MLASEFISKLSELVAIHGDWPISDAGDQEFDSVEFSDLDGPPVYVVE